MNDSLRACGSSHETSHFACDIFGERRCDISVAWAKMEGGQHKRNSGYDAQVQKLQDFQGVISSSLWVERLSWALWLTEVACMHLVISTSLNGCIQKGHSGQNSPSAKYTPDPTPLHTQILLFFFFFYSPCISLPFSAPASCFLQPVSRTRTLICFLLCCLAYWHPVSWLISSSCFLPTSC